MKTLEDLIAEKIGELIHYVLVKKVKPDMTVGKVTELDEDAIKRLKEEYGIEGIILDVDETLRKEMKMIPKVNRDWIESLQGQLKVIILSNGVDRKVENYFKERGITYIGFAHKPLRKNFLKACQQMELDPEQVLVIGDSLYDDVHGGKKNNMKTVLVTEVQGEKGAEENER